MKRHEHIEPGSLAILNMTLDNGQPFQVHGQVEALQEVINVTQAYDATRKVESHNVPVAPQKAVKPAENVPERPVYVEPTIRDKARQYFADAHIRRFDKAHGSNLYGELLEKRRKDALFLKAAEVGLLGNDSLYYKRKLGQLAKVGQ